MTDQPDITLPPRAITPGVTIFERLCDELGFTPMFARPPRVSDPEWVDPHAMPQKPRDSGKH